ncbi:L-lactate MFS transporter [Maribellus maritimus]|uniref:L-lactate MFS transporter n=1 Tax=Maribellus maritimus TaxID=2870838 RepID=UPI001EE9C150|nr:OFA family MFS transporter [Maribellus maritimus]MCG6189748.1 OFA family MFS transporter [Maribellus maritimus]
MNDQKVFNRGFVILGAILIQLALGAIYAWSVFTPSLKNAGWSSENTQWVFSAGLASFALFMVFAGKKLTSWGPQKLSWIGGIILGLGYMLAGVFGGDNFITLLILIGIVGGMGIGFAYVVPIAVGMRWFPDKKGMITGLAVAGFGFGAMLWVKLAGSWGHLIENMGLSATFIIYGIAFAAMVIIGGVWMKFPPAGWKPKDFETDGATTSKNIKTTAAKDFSSEEMLSKIQFYLIFLTFVFSAGAGLMSIGLMKLYPMQALMESGISETAASAIAGTAMAVFFSLANGLGRILWGIISDKIGRKLSIILMTGIQGITVILFTFMAGNEILLYLGATLIGFNFGGNFALFPTITADTFGAKNVGQNYPFVFLAYGVGGIFGPILGGRMGDLNNFSLAFTISGIAVLIGTLLILFVKPAKQKLPETVQNPQDVIQANVAVKGI